MDDREKLRQRFNREFANWAIELPVDAMSPSKVWLIVQRGWTIWTGSMSTPKMAGSTSTAIPCTA